MALPFIDRAAQQKRRVMAVDLGSRVTKAVYLERRGQGFALSRYALMDTPIFEKSPSPDLLSEHLKAIALALDAPTRQVALAVGVNDAFVRHLELPPRIAVDDVRSVLKHNAKTYLQQDLNNHVVDCHVIYEAIPQNSAPAAKTPVGGHKQKVLITAAKKQLVENFAEGIRRAGLTADAIVPGLIGPVNVFEQAMPEAFEKEVVALVDIGFKGSSICILHHGEFALLRVVNIGGDRITTALSETMSISYAEAEGIKLGMPSEVQDALEPVVTSLAQELRASIDFFEHQQDKVVTQVFLSGGSARSELIVQILQSELMAQCRTWNPTSFLQLALPPQQTAELEKVAPELTVALGTALSVL